MSPVVSLEEWFEELLKDHTVDEILELSDCSAAWALTRLYEEGLLELPDAMEPPVFTDEGTE